VALKHLMTIRMAIKLTILGVLIVAVFYWLRGHDILTGVAMLVLFLAVVAKVVAAIISRPEGGPPLGNGGEPPGTRMPRPPGGRPPALSATAEPRHESAT
jgi:hypothetical protein